MELVIILFAVALLLGISLPNVGGCPPNGRGYQPDPGNDQLSGKYPKPPKGGSGQTSTQSFGPK